MNGVRCAINFIDTINLDINFINYVCVCAILRAFFMTMILNCLCCHSQNHFVHALCAISLSWHNPLQLVFILRSLFRILYLNHKCQHCHCQPVKRYLFWINLSTDWVIVNYNLLRNGFPNIWHFQASNVSLSVVKISPHWSFSFLHPNKSPFLRPCHSPWISNLLSIHRTRWCRIQLANTTNRIFCTSRSIWERDKVKLVLKFDWIGLRYE